MITGCCACPARSAAFKSKGFGEWEAARNIFILFTEPRLHGASIAPNLFLDHDRPSHLRVNRAKILVSAGSSHRDGELLIGVERSRFLELLPNAHDRVGFFVPVNPGHLLS